MLSAQAREMCSKRLLERRWEQRDTVLPPLAVADEDLAALEIDVFDPKPRTFEDSQPGAVKE